MLGTLFALVIGVAFFVLPLDAYVTIHMENFSMLLLAIGSVSLLVTTLVATLSINPIQRMQTFSARIVSLYAQDNVLRSVFLSLLLFSVISFLLYIFVPMQGEEHLHYNKMLFAVWIILLGIYIDLLRYLLRKNISYLNPLSLADMFTKEAKKCVTREHDLDLCQWVDALTEVALKAIKRSQAQLCSNVIDNMLIIEKHFLDCLKSIGHHTALKKNGTEAGISDEINYVLFYIFQRMDLINERAVADGWESISSRVVRVLGKMAIAAGKFDVSLSTLPLHFLGKCTSKAQEKGFSDVPFQATIALMELAKAIVTDIDITYMDIQTPFLRIISELEKIAKKTFSRDKRTNLTILLQPFLDLKTLISAERYASHQDTPVILRDLDRVLGEFAALEMVMKTIPPIPSDISKESRADA